MLARTASTGNLFCYPGNGTYVDNNGRTSISGGWKSMNALLRVGDLNRDGYDDVVARQASNGYLYFYPGKSNGKLSACKLLSKDFKKMREITAIGDLAGGGYPDLIDRDGYTDLAAVQKSDGTLVLFRGTGSTLRAGVPIATGSAAARRNSDLRRTDRPPTRCRGCSRPAIGGAD